MSFPRDSLVTIVNGDRLERARITRVDEEFPVVASVEWSRASDTVFRDVIYAGDEGLYWMRGHGDDVESVLLLPRSAS
jgi:hypothetical protein